MAIGEKKDTTGHSFLAYFKRATSPLVVLHLLGERPMYGYELTQELKKRSGGDFTISVLYRLEEQGHVEVVRSEVADNRDRHACWRPGRTISTSPPLSVS